uniref:Putative secreted protein n=1 Tax=Anopheles darlingi TaxID=43151 RepID=A0A2M4DNC2_ANODA
MVAVQQHIYVVLCDANSRLWVVYVFLMLFFKSFTNSKTNAYRFTAEGFTIICSSLSPRPMPRCIRA